MARPDEPEANRKPSAMPYMHKSKWGAVDALSKKELVVDPHQFSAEVGTIRYGPKDAQGNRETIFWRTKTRCSSHAEWMELHDAQTGAVLWRAEARFADRGAVVESQDAKGKKKNEFLTVVRLYLEAETKPRLMIVHRDTQPAGLAHSGCQKVLAVYMLDANADSYSPPQVPGAESSSSAGGNRREANLAGPSHEELLEHFDFAALPAGEDIFQLTLSQSMTSISLAAMRLPSEAELQQSLGEGRGVKVNPQDVRTLARLKTLAGVGGNE